jgi:hypothetical protein
MSRGRLPSILRVLVWLISLECLFGAARSIDLLQASPENPPPDPAKGTDSVDGPDSTNSGTGPADATASGEDPKKKMEEDKKQNSKSIIASTSTSAEPGPGPPVAPASAPGESAAQPTEASTGAPTSFPPKASTEVAQGSALDSSSTPAKKKRSPPAILIAVVAAALAVVLGALTAFIVWRFYKGRAAGGRHAGYYRSAAAPRRTPSTSLMDARPKEHDSMSSATNGWTYDHNSAQMRQQPSCAPEVAIPPAGSMASGSYPEATSHTYTRAPMPPPASAPVPQQGVSPGSYGAHMQHPDVHHSAVLHFPCCLIRIIIV